VKNNSLPPVLALTRPFQWTKNLLCLGGVLFSGNAHDPELLLIGLAAVAVMTLASAAVYCFNDIRDREFDRNHPLKSQRPVASGAVSVQTAALLGIVLAVGSLAAAYPLGVSTLACIAIYLVLGLLYSVWLKHVPLFDVISLSMGFVLRLLVGIYATGQIVTSWIVLCTFFLAMLLGCGKRRSEVSSAQQNDDVQRPVLSSYSIEFLDLLVISAATITLIFYALFTAASGKNPSLAVTVPFVYYGVMHYSHLLVVQKSQDEPARILLKDRPMQLCILFWLITYLVILYTKWQLFDPIVPA
jgi:4-hydroxybenzoate polyprenyltransferase